MQEAGRPNTSKYNAVRELSHPEPVLGQDPNTLLTPNIQFVWFDYFEHYVPFPVI